MHNQTPYLLQGNKVLGEQDPVSQSATTEPTMPPSSLPKFSKLHFQPIEPIGMLPNTHTRTKPSISKKR